MAHWGQPGAHGGQHFPGAHHHMPNPYGAHWGHPGAGAFFYPQQHYSGQQQHMAIGNAGQAYAHAAWGAQPYAQAQTQQAPTQSAGAATVSAGPTTVKGKKLAAEKAAKEAAKSWIKQKIA